MKNKTYLAVADVSVTSKYRWPGMPGDGVCHGWLTWFDDGTPYFIDDVGWAWCGTGHSCKILKRSKKPAPKAEHPYTPMQWDKAAKKINFNPKV